MTQPEHPPYNPNQPGSQPTSTFPTGGNPQQGGPGQPHGGPGQLGQPGAPGRVERIKSGPGLVGYLLTILAAVVAVVIAVFIAQNGGKFPFKFFTYDKMVTVRAGLGAALVAGFLIGLFLGLLPQLSLRRELRGYRRTNR